MNRILHVSLALLLSLLSLALVAQPANDECSGAERLNPFPRLQSCPGDDGVVFTASTPGNNIGATPSSPYPLLPCGTDASADVWYTFQASGAINTVTVNSNGLSEIQLLGFVGDDCDNLQARACAVGSGSVSIEIITAPGTAVYLTVAGAPQDPDDQGNFTIDVESTSDCAPCARGDNGEIIFNPRNQTGTYACGETVEVCFNLFEWSGNEGNSIEWLHSIVPQFGSGWDPASVTPTSVPAACNGNGNWNYYPNGWTGSNTGDFFEYGFAFESSAPGGSPNNPGDNWGDGSGTCINYPANSEWCFNVNVKECDDTFTGDDLSISISVYSDFVSGVWTQSACASPTFTTIGSVFVCDDDDPLVVVTNISCPGETDGSVVAEGNGGDASGQLYNFTLRDGNSQFIAGCNGCSNPQTFDNLPPGSYTITTTGTNSFCPKSVAFDVVDMGAPSADLSFSEVCPGDGPIELMATTDFPGNVITFDWTGPNNFSASGANVFTDDPAVPGTYTVLVISDGCVGDPVTIDVNYIDFEPMGEASPDAICFGESTTLIATNFDAGSTFEWYDPDGNVLSGNDESLLVTPSFGGSQIYQVLVTSGTCSQIVDIPVAVADEILAEIVMDPNGEVCVDNDITFSVQMQGGGQFPAGWTFAWDNNPPQGSFVYTRNEMFAGQYDVFLTVTNPAGCSADYQEVFTVNAGPQITFDVQDYTICGDGSVEIVPTITGGAMPFEYLWGPDEVVTTPTLTVDANTTTTEAIYLQITDNNGCVTFSDNFADVNIIQDIQPVTFAPCAPASLDEVTFSWNDVGQDYFEVYITINGGAEILIDDEYELLSYTATGLDPGSTVTIRVIPFAGSGATVCSGDENSQTCMSTDCPAVAQPTVTCGDSGLDFLEINWTDVGAESYTIDIISIPAGATTDVTGTTFTASNLDLGESVTIAVTAVTIAGCPDMISDTITCIAQSCGPVTPMITTPVDTFCADGSAGLIDLTVDVPATGTVEWSGPGVTGAQFDPVAAGGGYHEITVIYSEGTCMYSASFELGVETPPNVVLSQPGGADYCQGEVATFVPVGTFEPGTSIEWIIPAGATITQGGLTTFDTLALEVTTPGAQEVQLVITPPFCAADTLTESLTVFATPVALTLDCENVSFDQVGFTWNHPDAVSYDVQVISAPATATITQTATTLLATGLAEGESVEITVTAVLTGPCGDVSATQTCTAASCPVVTVALDAVGPFCFGASDTVALSTNITSADNNGTLSYLTAPGVVGTDFVSTNLAVGSYQVIASYNEAGCTFTDTITVEITAAPVATIALDTNAVCINETVGAAAGAVEIGWNYAWNFGTDASPATANGAGPHDVAWSTAGTKTITLVPTDANGCEGAPATTTVEVSEPLTTPVIGCGVASFTSVEFGWDPITGATGYEVSINGGTPFTQDSTNFLVDGLNQGDIVNITVIALGDGPCGDSASSSQDCEAGSCPTITLTPMDDMSFCTGAANNVVTLSAMQSGGAGTGVFEFVGAGVTENNGVYTFDADAAGPGTHQIDVLYSETICTATTFSTMTVTETPESPFVLNGSDMPLTVCEGEEFNIAYTGPLTMADGATFDWNFAGAATMANVTFEAYNAIFATAGTYTIELTVTLDGCVSDNTLRFVTVEEPLQPLVISCASSTLNSVTFTWNDVPGATGYQLADGTILPAGTTIYTINGVPPGQDTTITLTALSDGACGNGISTTSQPCTTDACPVLTLNTDNLVTQTCLENGNETIDLSTVVVTGGTGNGTYVFSGPGVTGTTFDAAAAGGNEAGETHTITVTYAEEGPCTFTGTFEVTVFERPSAFILDVAPVCVNQGAMITVGSTNFVANQNVTVDFDGGTIIADGNPDDATYLVSWDTPGTKFVTATIVSNISGCESLPTTVEVTVVAPLETPVITCPATPELESILFSWGAVAGATGYEVTVTPGGTTTLDAATTTFQVDGLTPETTVSISVTALGDAPCGNSSPGFGACETAPCPGGSVQVVTPATEQCLDGSQSAITLEAELDQGTPTGPFVWSGTGVVNNNDGTFSFDPTGLGAGEYTLFVNYEGEADCNSSDEVVMTLFDQPSSAFGISDNVICTQAETTVGLTGSVDDEVTYSWNFAGAAQTAGPTAESYVLSWPTPGTYTITLTASANGCETSTSQQVIVDPPANSGTASSDDIALCAGNASDIDLNTLLSGQDAGGTWAVAAGSPGNVGGLDVSSGMFNAGGLSAGAYLFEYRVASGTCPSVATEVGLRLLAPPVAEAGEPRRLTCTMGMATLDGTASDSGDGFTYRWFSDDPNVMITGGDQPTLDVAQPGIYQLEVTNAIGCSSIDQVEVTAETEAPVMEVDVSNISCFSADDGAILVTGVSGGRAPYTYTLNGEERGSSTLFSGLMAQEYILRITDANECFSELILDLTEPEELTVRLIFPGDSSIVAAGTEVTVVANVNGGNPLDTLMWMPDSINTGESANSITFPATETQMISVTVVDELGCTATDREMLIVRKERRVFFPTAFSPNGDNINDIWFIGGDLDEIDFIDNFFIFDRWGEAVHTGSQVNVGTIDMPVGNGEQFLPNDPAFGWDGKLNGKTMNPQVLVYTATVHFKDGETIVYKGDFVLMR